MGWKVLNWPTRKDENGWPKAFKDVWCMCLRKHICLHFVTASGVSGPVCKHVIPKSRCDRKTSHKQTTFFTLAKPFAHKNGCGSKCKKVDVTTFCFFWVTVPLNRINPDEPVVLPIGCYPINTMVSGHQRLTHSWHSPGRPRAGPGS